MRAWQPVHYMEFYPCATIYGTRYTTYSMPPQHGGAASCHPRRRSNVNYEDAQITPSLGGRATSPLRQPLRVCHLSRRERLARCWGVGFSALMRKLSIEPSLSLRERWRTARFLRRVTERAGRGGANLAGCDFYVASLNLLTLVRTDAIANRPLPPSVFRRWRAAPGVVFKTQKG
jgi:hypothetical protein